MILDMYVAYLGVLGVMFGSFVNALVWRLHEAEEIESKIAKVKKKGGAPKKVKALNAQLQSRSILKGRSMCPSCEHALTAADLVPVFSWLSLRGRCRYCRAPISWQYPLVELITAGLFAASYAWWPLAFNSYGIISFVVWLVVLVGFMALLVYDIRWMTLPNKIVYPLVALTAAVALLHAFAYNGGWRALADYALSTLIASGMFWGLYELSKGEWIGGGDVKLGLVIGLTVGKPLEACLVLFFASCIGTLMVVPGMLTKKLQAKSHIPFGPFLIIATIIVKLFGASIISWYKAKILLY